MKDILKNTWRKLEEAVSEREHPFRTFSLSTSNKGRGVRQRMVVLRELRRQVGVTFYTDSRSDKVLDIRLDHNVSTLFYDPQHQIQIIGQGVARINLEMPQPLIKRPLASLRDYMTAEAPGKPIGQSNDIQYESDKVYCCSISIDFESIEYLRLDRLGHQRMLFKKKDGSWNGQYLVP